MSMFYRVEPNWFGFRPEAPLVIACQIRRIICPCVRPSHRCYGLCLRPIHVGERTGHGDHKCYNCLKAPD